MTIDLFDNIEQPQTEQIGPEAFVFYRGANHIEHVFTCEIKRLLQIEPPRQMRTPSGLPMSVLSSACGSWGWQSGESGYSYTDASPISNKQWPQMPSAFKNFAAQIAAQAGFTNFSPNSCLINCYSVGSKLGLHEDRDEGDFSQPIVSLSFGIPAIFLWGGPKRNDKVKRFRLCHGDVVVWGGKSRRYYHGVSQIKPGYHESWGNKRINLTLRYVERV